MKESNIKGYFTNHSLRVSATTRMHDAKLDEATIMSRTGHCSVDGVRAYKRTTSVLQELSSAILNCTIPTNTKGGSTIAEVKNTEETLVEEEEEKTTTVVKDRKLLERPKKRQENIHKWTLAILQTSL